MKNILYSLISLVVALFFILLGVIAALLPWSVAVRSDLISLILEGSMTLFFFGCGFILIGCAIVLNIFISGRRSYYELKGGESGVLIDENILQDYVQNYWKQIFPKSEVPTKLSVKRNRMHITADLPYVPKSQRDVVLEQIKHDLEEIFSKYVGYNNSFSLSISFQPEKNHGSET
jgi:hypothetical protein